MQKVAHAAKDKLQTAKLLGDKQKVLKDTSSVKANRNAEQTAQWSDHRKCDQRVPGFI